MEPERRRLFFALWPAATVAERLAAIAGQAQAQCGGRAMGRDSLHLTLAFLGDIEAQRVPVAEAAAADVAGAAFDLHVDTLGYWKHNHILWAGCLDMPEALAGLAGDLAAALRAADFSLDRRPFAAHVTLLRNARCGGLPPMGEAVDWPVSDFVLVESQPQGAPRYRPIARWKLGTRGS